ncbi:MAG: sigma-70 family RNA polymerase sigma factor [Bacteroidota bacterium]
MPEELLLLSAARAGDLKAFEEIIKYHEKVVASTIKGMIGDCPEAEDIGQETFIRFYNSLDRFRGESKIITYLVKIATNLSLNEIRRRKSLKQRLVDDDFEQGIDYLGEVVEKEQIGEIIRNAIQKLEPKFRSVIVLRLIDGLSTEETSNILGIPIGTVLSRLSRAQIMLKKKLSPLIEELK